MPGFVRRHGTTMLVAMVTAAVTAGGPVVAGPIADYARNADKVDGRHAVGASTGPLRRAGKLVATDARGRLPNRIIAKAPDADRLDGLSSRAFLKRGQASLVETVPARGTSGFQPPATTPRNQLQSFDVRLLDASFTTTRPGSLHLTQHATVKLDCTTGTEWAWLELDGTPIHSSMVRLSQDVLAVVTLTAVSDGRVAAGAHTMTFAAGCSTGSGSTSVSSYAPGTVVVVD